MATVGLLPEMMVTRIYDALLVSSIDLEALLLVLPEHLRGGRLHAREPQQQLAKVLFSLNNHRTSEDPPPIRTFLEWAVRMCGFRPQTAIFREALSLLEEGMTTEQIPEAIRQRRPWYLGIVKRLYQQQGYSEQEVSDSMSPVFVAYQDMRVRVVGIAVGEPFRILSAVQDHVRFMEHGAFRVEGHIVFPEAAPTLDEERAVRAAGLVPMRLEDVRRRAELYVRMRIAPSASGATARQTAWSVERCRSLGEIKLLERLRDSTADRLLEIIAAVREGRLHHVIIRASRAGLLAVLGCALLTAWNEVLQTAEGSFPLFLALRRPFPIDLDDLLDRTLAEQRVTSDRTVADSLFSDEESVPVVGCEESVALSDVQHILHPLLMRKRHCIVLAGESGSRDLGPLLRSRFVFEEELTFPHDFQSKERHPMKRAGADGTIGDDTESSSAGPLWNVESVAALWTHPDFRALVQIMKQYKNPSELRALAASTGFDVSRVVFDLELERAARDLIERAYGSAQLKAIIEAMRDDPPLRRWREDVLSLLKGMP